MASCRAKRGWLLTAALTLLAGTATLSAHAQYTFLRAFSGSGSALFQGPEDVKLDSNGNIFVVDSGNDRIEKFDTNTNFVTAFGTTGNGDGQLNQPLGVGIDKNNNIFVADTNNDRILKFTNSGLPAGNPQTVIGATGTGNGQFIFPAGVAFDSSNNLFVADTNNDRVQKFTLDNTGVYNYSSQFGSTGSGNGQLSSPYRLGLDSAGNVFVADTFNSRVEEFDNKGAFVRSFTFTDPNSQAFTPQGIAVDSAGNVFASDFLNNRIIKFSNTGVFLDKFGTAGTGNGQFDGADGIAVDSAGNVFVTDLNNNRVEEFQVAAVPEMGSLFMLASMVAGGLFMTRRCKKQTQDA
jgi:tripartite motif-containing protein 71